jgi:hypothetical protein
MTRRATVDAPSSCIAWWSLPSDITSPYAWRIIRRTIVVQPDRAVLGDSGTALEWGLARFGGRGNPLCQHYDLEREPTRGRISDDDVSDRGQTDQEGDEDRGKPA